MKLKSAKEEITVGLLWHSTNSVNYGVGALTQSQIAIIEEIASRLGLLVKFKVIGWFDPELNYIEADNIERVPLSGRAFIDPFNGLYSHFRTCDLICDIGAGDSFADIYGSKRFGYQIGSKITALLAGRPLILSPQTLGPFNHWFNNWLAKQVIRRCQAVSVRDQQSYDLLEKTNSGNPPVLTTDVAFSLPYETNSSNRTDGRQRLKIGVNASALLFHGGYNRGNMFGLHASYKDLINRLMQTLTSNANHEVHLVAHVFSQNPVEDDYLLARTLSEEFPGTVLAPQFKTPSDAKSYISGLDFFCGSRMHACIAALSSGVPVVPMAYSRKFSGVFGSLGYHHLADCQAETVDQIIAKVTAGIEQLPCLHADADKARAEADTRLGDYKQMLEKSIAALAAA